jgi:subtilisin family serine protease
MRALLVLFIALVVRAAVLTSDRPPIVVEPFPAQDDTNVVWVVRVRGEPPTTDELTALNRDGMDVLELHNYGRRSGTLLRVKHIDGMAVAAGAGRHEQTLTRITRAFRVGLRDGSGRSAQTVIAEPERPIYARVVWGLDRIDQRELPLDASYQPAYNGAEVRIYIVDTGVDVALGNFGGRASNGFTAYGSNYADQNGHGTHVAGTAASATYGVAKHAYIVNVKVLDSSGTGTTTTLANGLAWILAHGVNPGVVSMSLGMLGESSVVSSYCEDLIAANFALVAAAGNDDVQGCYHFPSATPGVLSVLASSINDVGASFNNYGECTDIFAPGVNVVSLQPGGGTASLSGTSMATPHVAGACALLFEQMPSASSYAIFSALFAQATNGTISNTKTSPNILLFVERDEDAPSTSSSGSSSGGSSGGGGGDTADSASAKLLAPVLVCLVAIMNLQ